MAVTSICLQASVEYSQEQRNCIIAAEEWKNPCCVAFFSPSFLFSSFPSLKQVTSKLLLF